MQWILKNNMKNVYVLVIYFGKINTSGHIGFLLFFLTRKLVDTTGSPHFRFSFTIGDDCGVRGLGKESGKVGRWLNMANHRPASAEITYGHQFMSHPHPAPYFRTEMAAGDACFLECCTHVGDLKEAPSSWLWIISALGSEPADRGYFSLYLLFSVILPFHKK